MNWVIVALEGELDKDTFHAKRPDVSWQIEYCGVGKVNAAITACRLAAISGVQQIVNYGTAGIVSNKTIVSQLVEPDVIIQRDMLTEPQAPRGTTPFEDGDTAGPILMDTNTNITLGTGDSFVMENDPWFEYANIDLVDMEGYAIAKACKLNNIKFSCWKYVSDFADSNAAEEWQKNINNGANLFMEKLNDIYS